MRIGNIEISLNKLIKKSEVLPNVPTQNIIFVSSENESLLGKFNPNCMSNLYTLYKTISEIQFPIKYISDRVKNAEFVIKKMSDDTIVWDNKEMNKFLSQPNPLMSFQEFLTTWIEMYYVNGNAYIFAQSNPAFSKNLWKYSKNYYILPSQYIDLKIDGSPHMFEGLTTSEIIKTYDCSYNGKIYHFDPKLILHSKDNFNMDSLSVEQSMKGYSRLLSQKWPIGNLTAVYEARNVIYTKRGALGFLVSEKGDADGRQALTPGEKRDTLIEMQESYGLTTKKFLNGILSNPLSYVKVGSDIKDLQPFEETLQDAISISGCFGVDPELIPRKDKSSYQNKKEAEANMYPSVIMPLVQKFCNDVSTFLGLNDSNLYLSAIWENIPALAASRSEDQERKKKISERCNFDFWSGLISLNHWLSEIGMEAINNPLYNKTLLEMTELERNEIKEALTKTSKTNV